MNESPHVVAIDDDEVQIPVVCPVHGKLSKGNYFAGKCLLCEAWNKANGGRRKAQPKVEKYLDGAVEKYEGGPGRFDHEKFLDWWKQVTTDPVRLATLMADLRRPRGVARERHGIALRRKEPMLNADPKAVRSALAIKDDSNKGKVPKDKLYRRVKVKPMCLSTVRTSGGSWRAQDWEVWTLKYGRGLVIVTEQGYESAIYPGWKSLKLGIEGSGWEIIG